MKLTRFHHLVIISIVLTLFVAGIFSYVSNSIAAFGTSPPWVKNDHMLPGTTFEQIINLSRSDTDKEMKANVKISGDKELVKWIKIEDEKNLIMREGQAILPMKVFIEAPKRAELKTYKGSIYVSMAPVVPESLGGGQVAITLGANISVDITVTGEKIIDYKVTSIAVNPLQEGKPFSMRLGVTNLGNVSVSNIEGKVDIYDETQTDIIKSLDFIPLDSPIAPDETKTSNMIFKDTMLDPGYYWAFVETFINGETKYANRLPVAVTEKVVPVVMPDDAMADLPKLPGTGSSGTEKEETAMGTAQSETVEVPVAEMKSAAPAGSDASSIFLIFGLAGLGFGLIALIGIIAVLVIILKNQQRPVQQGVGTPMIMFSPPAPTTPPTPSAPSAPPAPPAPKQMGYNTNNGNSGEANNVNVNAQNQQ